MNPIVQPQTELDRDFDVGFRQQLEAQIPSMRAFARNLCYGDVAFADDVAQDAMVRAWQARRSFTPGTNFRAWVFTILRNQFLTEKRKSWRQVSMEPDDAERTIADICDPSAALELDDLRRGLNRLHDDQREALILVGAGGVSYDDAAEILGVPAGTVKSRVSRARIALTAVLARGEIYHDGAPASAAMNSIMGEVAALRSRRLAA